MSEGEKNLVCSCIKQLMNKYHSIWYLKRTIIYWRWNYDLQYSPCFLEVVWYDKPVDLCLWHKYLVVVANRVGTATGTNPSGVGNRRPGTTSLQTQPYNNSSVKMFWDRLPCRTKLDQPNSSFTVQNQTQSNAQENKKLFGVSPFTCTECLKNLTVYRKEIYFRFVRNEPTDLPRVKEANWTLCTLSLERKHHSHECIWTSVRQRWVITLNASLFTSDSDKDAFVSSRTQPG